MNALQNILSQIQGQNLYGAWKGGGKRGGFDTGMETSFNTGLMERDRALKEMEDMERIRSLNPDYEALGKMFGTPQRGGGNPNIRGRFGAGQGSFVGPDMQMLDRQRNPGQFQPPERPRIVNNLTQLLRPYQG